MGVGNLRCCGRVQFRQGACLLQSRPRPGFFLRLNVGWAWKPEAGQEPFHNYSLSLPALGTASALPSTSHPQPPSHFQGRQKQRRAGIWIQVSNPLLAMVLNGTPSKLLAYNKLGCVKRVGGETWQPSEGSDGSLLSLKTSSSLVGRIT